MKTVKTVLALLLPLSIVACSSTGGQTNYRTPQASSVSIEVVPDMSISGRSNSIFGQCVQTNDARLVGNFSRSFYSNLSTLAQQQGVEIRGVGESKNDVIIELKLDADTTRNKITSTAASYQISPSGRVSRSVQRNGSAIVYNDRTANPNQGCQSITGEVANGFNQQINQSAQELARNTLDAMLRKGML